MYYLERSLHRVEHGRPADLLISATISDLIPTGATAAGLSKVTALGTSTLLPVGVPRLPIGLAGLAMGG
ncbi:hypothetical protein [Phyllobacterium sp. K27]